MGEWRLIQCIAMHLPLRHEPIHKGRKTVIVVTFQQMDHFMHDDAFEA